MATTIAPPSTTTFAARMKKTKSIKSNTGIEESATSKTKIAAIDEPASNAASAGAPASSGSADRPAEPPAGVTTSGQNQAQTGPAPTKNPADIRSLDSADPNSSVADASVNVSAAATSTPGKKSPPKRDPSKPSSNFTPTERTFILMAIAAVRADPKWRKHDDPDTIKDFSVPFCNAVRQKLIEDPDFKGKVAVASATPDREGKCKQSPSKESIRKIWTNLYLRGSITRDYTNMGRKKDLAAEERVKQYVQQNPDCKMSSRAIAAHTNTSNRNVIRILRQENFAIRKTKFRRPDESVKKRVRRNTKKNSNTDDQSLLDESECNN